MLCNLAARLRRPLARSVRGIFRPKRMSDAPFGERMTTASTETIRWSHPAGSGSQPPKRRPFLSVKHWNDRENRHDGGRERRSRNRQAAAAIGAPHPHHVGLYLWRHHVIVFRGRPRGELHSARLRRSGRAPRLAAHPKRERRHSALAGAMALGGILIWSIYNWPMIHRYIAG